MDSVNIIAMDGEIIVSRYVEIRLSQNEFQRLNNGETISKKFEDDIVIISVKNEKV